MKDRCQRRRCCCCWQVLAEEIPEGGLQVEVRNKVGEGVLNEGCGAEWAQKVHVA